MKVFPVVYYINLQRREDRRCSIENLLSRWRVPKSRRCLIQAVDRPEHPRYGCSSSHIKALQCFLQSGERYCAILEDDFTTSVSPAFGYLQIALFLTLRWNAWDVVMLASNVLSSSRSCPLVCRVEDAQTTAGYLVTRQYAPVLLRNFQEGAELLKGDNNDAYALDIFMKQLQRVHRWYAFEPRIGRQGASYSDIERTHTDYGV
jgi:GR25 family glycosyltransferase involved in LPS biosynthesis